MPHEGSDITNELIHWWIHNLATLLGGGGNSEVRPSWRKYVTGTCSRKVSLVPGLSHSLSASQPPESWQLWSFTCSPPCLTNLRKSRAKGPWSQTVSLNKYFSFSVICSGILSQQWKTDQHICPMQLLKYHSYFKILNSNWVSIENLKCPTVGLPIFTVYLPCNKRDLTLSRER
jgi:hypothetical protein